MSDEKSIVIRNNNPIQSFEDVQRVATAMAKSGYFSDTRDAAQAIVKIMAGQEIGLGPFASMTGIHIIKGKPVLGANIEATLIKNDPRYDYRVTRHDNKGCAIDFFENGEKIGTSEFTDEDAKSAGLLNNDNWKKYPRNMYFARALSNGAKWYCPGVFGGTPVYNPDEFGLAIDEDGDVIEATAREVQPQPEPSTNGTRPYSPEVLKEKLTAASDWYANKGETATDNERKVLAKQLTTLFDGDNTKRYEATKYLAGVASTKELSDGMVKAMLGKWLEVSSFDQMPNVDALAEAKALTAAALKAEGQQELL